MTRDEVMRVPCPLCGARVGQACQTVQVARTVRYTQQMHKGRIRAAEAHAKVMHAALGDVVRRALGAME